MVGSDVAGIVVGGIGVRVGQGVAVMMPRSWMRVAVSVIVAVCVNVGVWVAVVVSVGMAVRVALGVGDSVGVATNTKAAPSPAAFPDESGRKECTPAVSNVPPARIKITTSILTSQLMGTIRATSRFTRTTLTLDDAPLL